MPTIASEPVEVTNSESTTVVSSPEPNEAAGITKPALSDSQPPKVNSEPHMDAEGLACFKEVIGRSKCYLEYGCGGSTVYAANVAHVPTIISVESDQNWAQNVRDSVASSSSKCHIVHCDVGQVRDWGTPVDKAMVENFWLYMAKPWRVAKAHNFAPDTILIDGRFRVASFLFSLISARVGTTILFDDYLNRPQYFIVEKFCQLQEERGRLGVFPVSRNYSVPEICEAIAKYSVIWD